MNGQITLILDTNIVIYYLQGDSKALAFFQANQKPFAISVITVAEVLSFNYDEMQRQKIEQFLKNQFAWLTVNEDIVFKTGRIRTQKKMKTPDAIIAGTALCHQLTLVTRNTQDFKHLPIQLINPRD